MLYIGCAKEGKYANRFLRDIKLQYTDDKNFVILLFVKIIVICSK